MILTRKKLSLELTSDQESVEKTSVDSSNSEDSLGSERSPEDGSTGRKGRRVQLCSRPRDEELDSREEGVVSVTDEVIFLSRSTNVLDRRLVVED